MDGVPNWAKVALPPSHEALDGAPFSTGDLLGKRLGCSSYITSDCSSEKKVRSKSPQGENVSQEKEAGHGKGEGAMSSCNLKGSSDLG